jgi:Carboxypeptidase regulatory-like domain
MKGKQYRIPLVALALLMSLTFSAVVSFAQSITTGDITGLLTDPSGAVVPNVTVVLKNSESGSTQSRTTNSQGVYRFSFLNPGNYTVSVNAPGFQAVQQSATVTVG